MTRERALALTGVVITVDFRAELTRIGDYGLANTLAKDNALTASLEFIRTRLNQFSPEEQGHLINWGYVLADAAMRRRVLPGPPFTAGLLPDPTFPQ
jgi:NTE family protein